MKYQLVLIAVFLSLLPWSMGCDLGEPPNPDPQFVKFQFKYDFGNIVDTFNGTLTKDLILDGSIRIPFWLTTMEQEALLTELARADFFNLPDTILALSRGGVVSEPNPGPNFLRVQTERHEKNVVWFYPLDLSDPNSQTVRKLSTAIWRIIESNAQYKRLPPARGGYL